MLTTCQNPGALVAPRHSGTRQRHSRAKTTLFACPESGEGLNSAKSAASLRGPGRLSDHQKWPARL